METITLTGKIIFNPEDVSKKHANQASWKIVAMVMLYAGDICDYQAWFLKKRYNLDLVKPLRGPHITFINDRVGDLKGSNSSEQYKNWDALRKKWDGKKITIQLSPDVRTDGHHWWLPLPEEGREEMHAIRAEIGLGRPYYGLHMSIGYDGVGYETHSQYAHEVIKEDYRAASEVFIKRLKNKGLLCMEDGKFVAHAVKTKVNLKHIVV